MSRRTLVALLVLLAAPLAAQPAPGTIDGVAQSVEDGAPIPFALVRVLAGDAAGAQPVAQVVTNANGRFHVAVASGDYRLQLARIGYRPIVSAVMHVGAGESLRADLRGTTQIVQLAPITVRSAPSCLTADRFGEEPRLATLWAEAREGVEIRRAFERQYRFARSLRQDVRTKYTFRGSTRRVQVDTTISEPDSALVRDLRRQALGRDSGYVARQGPGSFRLRLPDEKELLDDAFLATHCLETTIADADGALGLRFRPTASRRSDVRGVVWVDAATYQMRRIDVEHLDGDRTFAKTSIDYVDVTVGAHALRLPASGHVAADVGGLMGAMVRGADASLEYRYWRFEPVGAR